ncbi:hypothetical protein DFP72DRAFT_856102 [Ephemerocybe angulata]|uniref:Uncharacterized protein n=1 Tax=Ephemerocybe angulata TaxID=980116 RepID=A0A8H6HF40_9AGAR|nr:hypothetical protein DFP72DRAFT_856102 [Tulosesus angulatus]
MSAELHSGFRSSQTPSPQSSSPNSSPDSSPPSSPPKSRQDLQDLSYPPAMIEFIGQYQSQWMDYTTHLERTSAVLASQFSSAPGSRCYSTLDLLVAPHGPSDAPVCPAEVDGTARQWLSLIDRFNILHFEYRRTAQQLQYMTLEMQCHVQLMTTIQSLCLASGRADIAVPMAAAVETAQHQVPRLAVHHAPAGSV